MLVLAIPFFPAAYELVVRSSDKVVRSDTDPAIAWAGATHIQANAHPDGLASNQVLLDVPVWHPIPFQY
jgi:hypothetical protein